MKRLSPYHGERFSQRRKAREEKKKTKKRGETTYDFPSRSGEDMFVSLEPFSLHNLPCMRINFLQATVVCLSYIFVNVEGEERPTLASGFRLDQVVKRHTLTSRKIEKKTTREQKEREEEKERNENKEGKEPRKQIDTRRKECDCRAYADVCGSMAMYMYVWLCMYGGDVCIVYTCTRTYV